MTGPAHRDVMVAGECDDDFYDVVAVLERKAWRVINRREGATWWILQRAVINAPPHVRWRNAKRCVTRRGLITAYTAHAGRVRPSALRNLRRLPDVHPGRAQCRAP